MNAEIGETIPRKQPVESTLAVMREFNILTSDCCFRNLTKVDRGVVFFKHFSSAFPSSASFIGLGTVDVKRIVFMVLIEERYARVLFASV